MLEWIEAHPGLAARNLRLAGYEVYRFGSNELVGENAGASIERFFDRLRALHKITATS